MEQNSFPIILRCKAKLLRSMTPLICRLLFTSGRNKFIVLSFAYWLLFFFISLLTYLKKPFRKKNGYVSPEPVRCHSPFGFLSPLKVMQSQNEKKINNSLCSRCSKIYMNIFREEFVSNIRKT